MPAKAPFLSIVAVSRNDNHGGELLQRMQVFIDCLNEQVSRHRISAELIIVEWNPPEDRPSLQQALSWPTPTDWFSVRFITVPREIHKKLKNADKINLFQMIGKNVGIRRARGKFIVATNIDIIFSDDLMQTIARKELEPGYFYRVDRIDVDSAIPADRPLDEKLEYCRDHIIRINSRYYVASIANLKALFTDIAHNPTLLGYYFKNLLYKLRIPRLHYNACGDFTLMAKEDWDALRGYPELEIFSLHIDSLFLMLAYFSGYTERALSAPHEIYHIEHSLGSGITPGEGQKRLFERLDMQGTPYLSWRECVRLAVEYRNKRENPAGIIEYNAETWGLHEEDLPEALL